MLRNKCMVILLLILIAISNLVDAADKNYVVSFVAGQTELGLVNVTKTDTEIQTERASITPMGKTLGSTALLSFVNGWDGDFNFYVAVINRSNDAARALELEMFAFNSQLKATYDLGIFLQIPGQNHPLHMYTTNNSYKLLTTGAFGTSGANNYVSFNFSFNGRTKNRIFINPDNRSAGTAAVAPDGGLASQMTFDRLNHIGLIAKLNNGKLVGTPIQWLNVNDFQGYSQSLSNPIKSTPNTRYLAYRNFKQPGASKSQSKVMIQNVDAKTGILQGPPRAITQFATAMDVDAERLQSIAISPDGGLILYTAWNNECKKQILLARRLVNGSSVAKPSVVVGCGQLQDYPVGIYGINIARTSR